MSATFIILILLGVAVLALIVGLPRRLINHPVVLSLAVLPTAALVLLVIYLVDPRWVATHLPSLVTFPPWAWPSGRGFSHPSWSRDVGLLSSPVRGNELSFVFGAFLLPLGVALIGRLRGGVREGRLRASRRWGRGALIERADDPVRFWFAAVQLLLGAAVALTLGGWCAGRLLAAAVVAAP